MSMCRSVCRLPAWKDGGEDALSLYSQGDKEGKAYFQGRIALVIAIDMETRIRLKWVFPKPTNF